MARNSRFAAGETITLRVRRSDDGRLDEFRVPYRKWMRVLDALNWIAENAATDLCYRWFCGSKMCGTCAVCMNGREVLACWEAVEPDMTIEPLRNLPVIRGTPRQASRWVTPQQLPETSAGAAQPAVPPQSLPRLAVVADGS